MTTLRLKPIVAACAFTCLTAGPLQALETVKPIAPAADTLQRIEPMLKELAAQQTSLPVVIVLTAQPQHEMAKRVRAQYEPKIDELADQVRALYAQYAPTVSMRSEDEELAHAKMVSAQIPADVKSRVDELNKQREALTRQMRREIARLSGEAVADSQAKAAALIERAGGKIRERMAVVNSIAATIPSSALDLLAQDGGVIAEIVYDRPGKPELDVQADSLGADTWWSSGFDGGVWDVGVLDSGVAQTHPALSGHTTYENFAGNGSHGTGVACMYASTNATNRGLAFGLDSILIDNAGDTGTSMAGADWMVRSAGDDPEVINYSWGNGSAADQDWHSFSRFVDAIVRDYGTSWAKSAGNEGWGTTTITVPANNYNGLTVANIFDQNTLSRGDDRVWTSSSRGPTKNGRKKPDLAAPGHQTTTCDTGSGWTTLGGTSSAAPKVGAATLLLNDAGNWSPMAIKAVLINTADAIDDKGTESTADDVTVNGKKWNKSYGWGHLDLWHAHFHRNDYFRSTVKPNGQAGDYKLYKGYAYTGDKATLVWERDVDYKNAATPTSYRNLSDIDLAMYRETTNGLMDNDISIADNVHQVAANVDGASVVKVYAYSSSFDGASSESFALATEENFTAATGPKFTVAWTAPAVVLSNATFLVSARVTNSGDLDAHNVNVKLNLPAGYTLVSGALTQNVGRIIDGGSATATWTVRAPNYTLIPWLVNTTLSTSVSSQSYGESFHGSGSKVVAVN